MTDSLFHSDRSCIFRETFIDSFSVQNNRYAKGTISATGVKFENGQCFIDKLSNITYKKLYVPTKSTCIIKISKFYPSTTSGLQYLCGFGSSFFVRINDSTPNVYLWNIEGQAINNVQVKDGDTLVIVRRSISIYPYGDIYINGVKKFTNIIIGSPYPVVGLNALRLNDYSNSSTYSGKVKYESIELYGRDLSDSEVKLLHQQNLYSTPTQLPLLLDFDSTRGVIEDRTGKNVLTPTSISIPQIGKVKGAYFGGNAQIDTGNLYKNLGSSYVWSFWLKRTRSFRYSPDLQFFLRNSGGQNYSFYFNVDTLYIVDAAGNSNAASGLQIKKGFWYNLVFVVINNVCYAYANGTYIGGGVTLLNPTSSLYFGYNYVGVYGYIGYIPKVTVFSGKPLNRDQFAAQLYNSQKGAFGI